ncbi:MAG: hypothetical protein MUP17_05065 [candidate division Zixibacteria bacterium]|nr:hypothetical protein [candidate division Zixibacteria bacterium]
MRQRALFLGVMVWLLVCVSASADVPKLINFQGRLTDASGKFVPDGNYSVMFRFYTDSIGGIPKWTETQEVIVSKGLFNVILGSITPIPDSIFNSLYTWLGIKVQIDPEMTPRQRLSSLGYSYRTVKADTSSYSMNSDKLDGLDASDFLSPANDYGRSGVATDLYEQAITLSEKYVNVAGPDSVYISSGTAFLGKASGSSASPMYGIKGYADNASFDACGGYFSTSSAGTGLSHFGVYGAGYSSYSSAYGVYGLADNTSTGWAVGGSFGTTSNGTGEHSGVRAGGSSSSSSSAYGYYGQAQNTSTGNAYGGYFWTFSVGTGTHYGVYASEAAGGSGAAVYAAGDFAASGTKNAVLKTSKGHRLMSVIESPEVWFEDFGEGQLINGRGHVELDPLFLETVTINNLHPMKVFIQLKDDCRGTYVKSSSTSFDVFELQGGTSNASFSYRVIAKRKGYETERLRETDVGKDDPNLYPELWSKLEKQYQAELAQREEQRKLTEAEQNRTEQQRLEMKEDINGMK